MVKRVLNFIILEPSLRFIRSSGDSLASRFAVDEGRAGGRGGRVKAEGKRENNDLPPLRENFPMVIKFRCALLRLVNFTV